MALAHEAAKAGVRRFVYLSSAAVMGTQTVQGRPFTEESPLAPYDAYGHSKTAAEAGLHSLSRKTGMETVILRPPLVYGPGVKGNLKRLMTLIARGVPLPLGAITDNRRTLCRLDDLVSLVAICLDHPAATNQIFLVGDEGSLSTAEIIRRIARAMDVEPRLFPVSQSAMERMFNLLGARSATRRLIHSLQVDSSKARSTLGWNPQIDLDCGFRNMALAFLDGAAKQSHRLL
jgi:nucleoside-diphosphate-sugar epimerase